MSKFTSEKVVPDVLPAMPPALLKVMYGNINLTPGMVLTPTQVQNPPKLEWDADPKSFYTIFLHDPDAPSRDNPSFGEWHHWMVANVPGQDVSKGRTISDYVGSGPPKGTGLHRYVLVVCAEGAQPQAYADVKKIGMTGSGRAQQKLANYLNKYNLKVEAANFYQAEWDDYVPKLYAKLK